LQELFMLGADRGAYSEDDVRVLAGALIGWAYSWTAELAATTSASSQTVTTAVSRLSTAAAATGTGRTPAVFA
jgi:hypothetical protein